MIVDNIINKIENMNNNLTTEYLNAIESRILMCLDYTCLPERYMYYGIDDSKLPRVLKGISNRIVNHIDNNESLVIFTNDFNQTGYISSYLIYEYITKNLLDDKHIKSLLYIDTNLLMEDLKTLMGTEYSKDTYPILEYNTDILMREIYTADFIFWDKFNLADTRYETRKLYDILSRRFNHCKGNLYCLSGNTPQESVKNFDTELKNVMNIQELNDLSKETYRIIKLGDISNDK